MMTSRRGVNGPLEVEKPLLKASNTSLGFSDLIICDINYLSLSDGSIISLVPLLPLSPASCNRSLISEAVVSDPLFDLLTHL